MQPRPWGAGRRCPALPAEPRLRAPSGGPARPRGQGPGSLISEVPAPLQGQRRTPPGWSQDFTICKGIPRVASVRGLDMGGGHGGGLPYASACASSPGVRTVGGSPVSNPQEKRGSQSLHP